MDGVRFALISKQISDFWTQISADFNRFHHSVYEISTVASPSVRITGYRRFGCRRGRRESICVRSGPNPDKCSEPHAQSASEHATSTSRQNCVQIQYLTPAPPAQPAESGGARQRTCMVAGKQLCNNWGRGFRFTALERPSRSCRGHPWCHAICPVPSLFLGLY